MIVFILSVITWYGKVKRCNLVKYSKTVLKFKQKYKSADV